MPEDAVIDEVQEAPAEEPLELPEPVTDEPAPEEPEVEPPAEEEAPEEPEEEAKSEEENPDGRKMPDSLKKALAGIKATNPEAAKQIKGLFFADQEYRAAFAKPADAVAARDLIEQIGGHEGIQQIQAERSEWEQLDKSYAEGSGDFVKSIAEANPDAFLKIAPQAINEWANRAPEQYGYYANTVTLNTLNQAGISTQNLAAAYKAYEGKPEAQAIIAEIHNALLPLTQKKMEFESKKTDPREEQLKQRETQFEEKRRADFEGNVANQAENFLKEKMGPEITRVIGQRKVDPEAMKGFEEMVQSKVMKMLADTPNFASTLEAQYRTGDAQKSVAYITAQYNRILPIAAKVIEPYLRNIQAAAPVRKPGTPVQRSASPGEIVLKEMPDWDQVDRTKTSVEDLIKGTAILKNGKRATGWA